MTYIIWPVTGFSLSRIRLLSFGHLLRHRILREIHLVQYGEQLCWLSVGYKTWRTRRARAGAILCWIIRKCLIISMGFHLAAQDRLHKAIQIGLMMDYLVCPDLLLASGRSRTQRVRGRLPCGQVFSWLPMGLPEVCCRAAFYCTWVQWMTVPRRSMPRNQVIWRLANWWMAVASWVRIWS